MTQPRTHQTESSGVRASAPQNGLAITGGIYGTRWLTDSQSALDEHIRCKGKLGDWICDNFDRVIGENDVILDVGANAGYISIPIAKRFPRARLFAFEPDGRVRCKLMANVGINELINISIRNEALQDDALLEEAGFNIRRAVDNERLVNDGLSSLEPIALHSTDRIKCAVTTLDKFVANEKLEKVNFLKIDVEGSESKVMQGGRSVIARWKPVVLYESSRVIDQLTNSKNCDQAFEFMRSAGYSHCFELAEEKALVPIHAAPARDCNIICFHPANLPANLSLIS